MPSTSPLHTTVLAVHRDDRGRAAVSAADTLRAGGADLRGVVVV